MKRLVSAFLAGAMALSLAACGGSASTSTAASSAAASATPASSAAADSDLAYIQSNGKMVIGYTVYEPMNYTDADGSFTGFDTELATAAVSYTHLDVYQRQTLTHSGESAELTVGGVAHNELLH